jgi:hypothetical protein
MEEDYIGSQGPQQTVVLEEEEEEEEEKEEEPCRYYPSVPA